MNSQPVAHQETKDGFIYIAIESHSQARQHAITRFHQVSNLPLVIK